MQVGNYFNEKETIFNGRSFKWYLICFCFYFYSRSFQAKNINLKKIINLECINRNKKHCFSRLTTPDIDSATVLKYYKTHKLIAPVNVWVNWYDNYFSEQIKFK